MERDLLEQMMQERDDKIAMLQSKRRESDDKIAELQGEVETLRLKVIEQDERHKIDLKILSGKKVAAEELVNIFKQDLKDNEALLEYVKLIKEATPDKPDTAYITKLKAQLTKAIHSIDLMEQQVKTLQDNYQKIINSLKEEISVMIEEKCKVEVDLLNKLAILDHEKREVEKYYKDRLRKNGEEDTEINHKLSNDSNMSQNDEDEGSQSDDDECEEGGEDINAIKSEIEALIGELESVNIEKKSSEARLSFIIQKKDDQLENLQKEYNAQQAVIESLRSEIDVKTMT